MKAVVLAGGLGTRLLPYTMFLPKPMLPLGEKPVLEHLVDWTRRSGIRSLVLCVSYLRRAIEDYFEDGRRFGVEIEYAVSDRPLATAGQLKTAQEFIDGSFVCMYGDSLYNFSLRRMVALHKKKGAAVTMGIYEHKASMPYGVIETARSGRVTGWNEKPEVRANVNMGCYVMEPEVLDLIPGGRPYGMDRVIRAAIARKMLVTGFVSRRGFTDIGDKESYRRASRDRIRRLGGV